jgi:hypothetical protein
VSDYRIDWGGADVRADPAVNEAIIVTVPMIGTLPPMFEAGWDGVMTYLLAESREGVWGPPIWAGDRIVVGGSGRSRRGLTLHY